MNENQKNCEQSERTETKYPRKGRQAEIRRKLPLSGKPTPARRGAAKRKCAEIKGFLRIFRGANYFMLRS